MSLTRTWRTKPCGQLLHDGDCLFWDYRICTCGLLHHLNPRSDKEEVYPDFWPEFAAHCTMVDEASTQVNLEAAEAAMERQTRERTPEEQAEFDDILRHLFHQ